MLPNTVEAICELYYLGEDDKRKSHLYMFRTGVRFPPKNLYPKLVQCVTEEAVDNIL